MTESAVSHHRPAVDGNAIGVNALATWDSTTGLAEAARRSVETLLDLGVDVALDDVEVGAPREPRRLSERLRGLARGRPHAVDLCFLNVNELVKVGDDYLRNPERPNYLIGSWFWEMLDLPRWVQRQARRVDEIWVASEFAAQAFRRCVDVPITLVPVAVAPQPDQSARRPRFGIRDGACTFLFNFDPNSTFARKNPWGLIEAFRTAFTASERRRSVQLVVKTFNLSRFPEGAERLRHELDRAGGLLLDTDLTAGEMAALISCCDVYVSLHRAEGFGLGMAEAMYLGRPVIATNYSGNRDFATSTTSLPVSYRLREVRLGELRYNAGIEDVYEPGMLWAEPNLDEAARWMRHLYANPEARAAVGARGRAWIREHYSSVAAGAAMRVRLGEIAGHLAGTAPHGGS